MTNQPLTAEHEPKIEMVVSKIKDHPRMTPDKWAIISRTLSFIEEKIDKGTAEHSEKNIIGYAMHVAMAYAAQQNAELVAELNTARECCAATQIHYEEMKSDRDTAKAENERLKEQLAMEEAANNSERDEQQHIIFELQEQVATLRDAIAKKLSQNDHAGFCLLEAYAATQPPKEPTTDEQP